ncbi:hypothetical protein K502DRAFT_368041 [Neoconidiobolus thromboides FSU 785]|nr:hypothetical protein K502DRAFT_368041 [Neoconidiobolus thromboides FSU 785]
MIERASQVTMFSKLSPRKIRGNSGSRPVKLTSKAVSQSKQQKQIVKQNGNSTPKQPFRVPIRQSKPITSATSESNEPGSPYIPLAERMRKIVNEVPDRFLSKPRIKRDENTTTKKPERKELTQPRSPRLQTRLRAKVHHHNPIIQEVKPFKALPLDPRIMNSSGDFGVPKVKKTPLTVVKEFRFSELHSTERSQNEQYHNRQPNRNIKVKTIIKKRSKQLTKTIPFKFPSDEITARKRERFQRRLEKEKEELEKARKFKALPLPKIVRNNIIGVEPRPPTIPEPFRFQSEERVRYHQSLQQRKDNEEQTSFTALPMPKFKPIPIKRCSKPPTKIEPFILHSEKQAKRRQTFDLQVLEKMEQREKRRKMEEELQRKTELNQYLAEKKLHEFKAKPMPKYHFFIPKPSQKALTIPQTPIFAKPKYFKGYKN